MCIIYLVINASLEQKIHLANIIYLYYVWNAYGLKEAIKNGELAAVKRLLNQVVI